MLPEDIIQQKEWTELTEAEHQVVVPLAANQGEYNLLKKMLQVAAADAVPQVDGAVLRNLHTHLPGRQKKRFPFWYAAAAVLFAAVVGIFFIASPKKGNELAASPPAITTPKPVDTSSILPPILPSNPSPDAVVRHHPASKHRKEKRLTGNDRTPANSIAVTTSVGANTALLDFVTEVY